MHSGALERAGSPRKRTLSRGVSEDESLRNIIKETESSTRRLTHSDSRGGTLKRRSGSQQSVEDQELMELPEMNDLQASYDDVLQELRGLELQRETLLFQVDVLQDALEGAEEMLAEAQREASHATMEVEREREAKRKLEDIVSSLMQEVERLKEGRGEQPSDSMTRASPLHVARMVSSEDVADGAQDSFTKFTKIVNKTFGPLSLGSQTPGSNQEENGRDLSPDRNNDTDSISAYEDACADMPELEEGDGPRLPHDEGSPVDDEGDLSNGNEPKSLKNPNESCILS
ncbi:unnamed protein product [Oncorhynchus mykiss]|uniref:Uncharacterized protein n=1 Tax=Oncorhynchus mykiss TaxID=8022 RepID=A0A060WMD9_ONCMY|nr:unnamed protein product [Oncorhynchus mykiss]